VDALERVRVLLEEPVERVGQRAVRGEPHRVARAQDRVQPRVVAAGIAASEGLRREAVARHRHEVLSLEAEQAGGVVGDDAADGGEETGVTVPRREGGGEVPGDLEQCTDRDGVLSRLLFV
jgi:hypothetical protein